MHCDSLQCANARLIIAASMIRLDAQWVVVAYFLSISASFSARQFSLQLADGAGFEPSLHKLPAELLQKSTDGPLVLDIDFAFFVFVLSYS